MITNKKLISLIDHTNLNDNESFSQFKKWFLFYKKYISMVASICVYEKNLLYLSTQKINNTKLCTVINFPSGHEKLQYINKALAIGLNYSTNEFDIVVNYDEYNKKGISLYTTEMLKSARLLLENKTMKVIIECGMIKNKNYMMNAVKDAAKCGADFIKTSTGKNKLWSETDLNYILKYLKSHNKISHKKIGLKISGGVSSIEAANKYIRLVESYMGKDFIQPKLFRIGSSKLLKNILN